MKALESYSVYNILQNNNASAEHALREFLPESNEKGWHVSRNLKKPLNHLDFLRDKERIANRLNLHNVYTPESLL